MQRVITGHRGGAAPRRCGDVCRFDPHIGGQIGTPLAPPLGAISPALLGVASYFARARLRMRENSRQARVLAIWSAVSQARRAVATA